MGDHSESNDSQSGKLRILIVDDCHDTASSMQRLCVLLGYDALAVTNGLAAIDVMTEYRPKIVIMDISMPRLDGITAAERIRQLDSGSEIVLVAMTGWGDAERKQRILTAGFDLFWLKPVELHTMQLLFDAVKAGRPPAKH